MTEFKGDKMKTEDYEKLEGKIIDYYNEDEHCKALVIGCDPDIGITIVKKDDPNCYLTCLIGPSSSLWKENNKGFCKKRNKIIFKALVNQIKTGVFDWPATKALWNLHSGISSISNASAESCPFGQ